jgi:hypothetical protein
MQSTFAWLDHSEVQRRRMMEVVGLFREKGTLDELGIGSVRDALSELLFPGTSTLHTRARYLLFLPWIFLGIEHDRVSSRAAAERVKRDEIRLIDALDQGEAGDGIIGVEARERLSQFPSMMYWTALGRYGIRRLPATRSQYLRSLDSFYLRLRHVRSNDDGERIDGVPRHWHAGLPPAPKGLFDKTSFALSVSEADYLTERVVDRCPGTYLAHLVRQSVNMVNADAPWTHPAAKTAPAQVAEHLQHARAFSDVMHGALLLYGLILSELVREGRTAGADVAVDADTFEDYGDRLDKWRTSIATRHDDLEQWDRQRFWQLVTDANPRIPRLTVLFVRQWIEMVLSRAGDVAGDATARQLVAARERQVKRSLARVGNARALERWSGRAGTAALRFRWPQVQQVTSDIVAGRKAPERIADART